MITMNAWLLNSRSWALILKLASLKQPSDYTHDSILWAANFGFLRAIQVEQVTALNYEVRLLESVSSFNLHSSVCIISTEKYKETKQK